MTCRIDMVVTYSILDFVSTHYECAIDRYSKIKGVIPGACAGLTNNTDNSFCAILHKYVMKNIAMHKLPVPFKTYGFDIFI